MGSLRSPVGPLPSSIYWRRRAVAATLIALLALLVVWVVTSGGGGGKKDDDRSDGANPATSITPGPSGSGPAISEQPGGRDESGGSGESGATGGSGGGSTDAGDDGGKNGDPAGTGGAGGAGSGGTAGAVNGGGTAGTDGGTGGVGGSTGGASSGGGRSVPADSTLPNCAPGSLILRLDITKNAYETGEKPTFQLIATNTSNTSCKADFGPKAVVVAVTDADDDEMWSSKDCPKTGTAFFEVPADGTITRTVQWDRKQSAPQCATPPAGAVGPGTYLVEIKTAGASVQQGQKSIRLEKD